MLYDLFQYARKNGMAKLETDIEEPEKSPIFSKYPKFAKNHHALHFVCDTLRMYVSGGVNAFELDQMMELDMDVHHAGVSAPVNALTTMADSLPGLGIVAAVLGVVITMGSIGGPPEEVGHKVAAALVGTFLGILLCYGFLGPMASSMAKVNEAEAQFYHFLRVALAAFVRGAAPILATEFARRTIPAEARPTFKEMEESVKRSGAAAAPAEQSAA
jgi:chemotaxis protein MotA